MDQVNSTVDDISDSEPKGDRVKIEENRNKIAETIAVLKVPNVPSGYVNIAELRARSKQKKESLTSNVELEKVKVSMEKDINPAIFPISTYSKAAEESRSLESPDLFKNENISKSSETPLAAYRSGSDSVKRKSSDEGGDSISTASRLVREGILHKKRFNIGQNVLIPLNSKPMVDSAQEDVADIPAFSIYVNQKGFPPTEGLTESERYGPYSYVIAEVVKLHFDEDYIYYTVKRHDNEALVRADKETMLPIKAGSPGETAALMAAKKIPERNYIHESNKRNWFQQKFRIPVVRWVNKCCIQFSEFFKDQAHRFTSGSYPYRIQMQFTTVNFFVICAIIVAFLETFKHAFLPLEADSSIAVILCIAWSALVLELMLEVIVRPQNFSLMLKDERAYLPSTARYINLFHLTFELLALGFAFPEWIGGMTDFSNTFQFANIAIEASVGSTTLKFMAGHLKLMLHRFRLFGLYRHRRNYWIRMRNSDTSKELIDTLSCENDTDLRNASNISIALLVVNSQRALMLLIFITSIIPYLASPADGGQDKSMYLMTDYLDRINQRFVNATTDEECSQFGEMVSSWLKAENYHTVDTSLAKENSRILWIKLDPPRCGFDFNDIIRNTVAVSCSNETSNDGLVKDLERNCGLRNLYLYKVVSSSSATLTEVVYNLSETVFHAALRSFILQLVILLLGLLFLNFLRLDASNLVIAPLRRMLSIVISYSENPLIEAPSSETKLESNNTKESNNDSRLEKKQLGVYETEQLITAITRITELLRKCWGVAGSGIISANLARNRNSNNPVTFNPTVPGKRVHAIFGFVGINDFSHILRSLDRDVMNLINDVAKVVHSEVYRWGFGESGQCNKNLGSSFLLVYRIGEFKEVFERQEAAQKVIFSDGESDSLHVVTERDIDNVQLSSLPGIQTFADRALLGILKSFACINRDRNIKEWERDYRLGAGVGAYVVELSFGMDAGWAMEGAVGSSYKIDATYLSPHVNMAARMMAASKQYNLSILFSENVANILSKEAKDVIRHIDTVVVKGSSKPIKVYTYDAREKGNDFFLNERSEKDADKEATKYSPSIWKTDADLRDMRSHITPEFLTAYNIALSQYLNGCFEDAIVSFRDANELMIMSVIDDGKIPNASVLGSKLLDPDSLDEEVQYLRKDFGDGPCQTLIAFIETNGLKKPTDWKGYRKLTSK